MESPASGEEPPDVDPPNGPDDLLAALFRNGRTNAMVSWVLVGAMVVVLADSLLDADWLWVAFVAVTGVVVLLPPAAYDDWRMMLPWELLVLALLPILVRATVGGELGTFASYLSLAALALVVTVELHVFTPLKMTHWFAVTFVAMATMASAAAWAIVRWSADRLLGTSFLLAPGADQESANAALMVEFVWVSLAGLAAGVIFDAYFRRRDRHLARHLWRFLSR